MSRNRLIAIVAVALLAATTTPAFAAKKRPKPVCNLVKDAADDASVGGVGATTYDPSLDIVSADIGVSGTMLTAVIRVKDLTRSDTLGTTGRTWGLSLSNGTASVGLNAYVSPLGGEQFNTGKGKIDYAADQVRVHVLLKDLPHAKIKKGAVLRGFYVTSNVVVGLDPSLNAGHAFAPLSGAVDATPATTAAFPVGTLSCVKVGA